MSHTYFLIISESRVYGIADTIGGAEAQRRTFEIPFDVRTVVARSYKDAVEIAMFELKLKLCKRMEMVYHSYPKKRGRERIR